MGVLTHKEREALEDIFLSIHSKSKTQKFLPSIKKVYKLTHMHTKKGYVFLVKSLKNIFHSKIA